MISINAVSDERGAPIVSHGQPLVDVDSLLNLEILTSSAEDLHNQVGDQFCEQEQRELVVNAESSPGDVLLSIREETPVYSSDDEDSSDILSLLPD